jgi:chromosome condensin MukBEF ATPase and DNA-binding subunit MukB
LEYFCQSVNHPGATLSPVELPSRRITSVPLAGDKITFSEVSFQIILDEDMTSYREMYDWMIRITNDGQVSAGETMTKAPTYADITLSVLSSHNNTTKKIRYKDCVPTSLGTIDFQSTTGATSILTFDASFRFAQFEIV